MKGWSLSTNPDSVGKPDMTHRFSILTLGGLLCLGLWGCQDRQEPAAMHPVAEQVFVNGAIYTADGGQHSVSAMGINGDRILFTGDEAAAQAWVGPDTVVTDLGGRRVLPGLHDAHVHPVETIRIEDCNLENRPVDLAGLADFARNCLERLAPAPGDWLVVKQWNFAENNLPAGDLTTLRQALDRASTEQPIIVQGSDHHHYATNSAGLARATNAAGERVGLNASTLTEHFGDLASYIGVDERGEPNGEVNEGVYHRLGVSRSILMNLPALIPESAQIPARYNSMGITSLFDAKFEPLFAPIYDTLVDKGTLTLRVALAQYYDPTQYCVNGDLDLERIMAEARMTREKYRSVDNVKADHLKYFLDGVLEGNPLSTPPTLPNAAQLKDYQQPRFALDETSSQLSLTGYVDPDSETCRGVRARGIKGMAQADIAAFLAANGFHPAQCLQSNGVLFEPDDITRRFVEAAVANDFSVHFHVIGDRAVRSAIDAIAEVTDGTPATNRHSLAHVQLIHPDDVARVGRLHIPIAFTYAWAVRDHGYDATVIPFIDRVPSLVDMYEPDQYYMQQAYPTRSIMAAGGVLAGGSDAPVDTDDPRPFHNIEKAVTRDEGDGPLNADEGIPIRDAIDAYTIGGARLMAQAEITGSLEPGKKADFIILDRDPIALAESGRAGEISQTQVLETWFDGREVYRAAP